MGQNLIQTLSVQLEKLVQKSKLNNKLIVYTLGNTRVLNNSNFYPTPIREFDTFIVAGMVVFSENEAKIVLSKVDNIVDYLFVDCEKKSKNNSQGFFNIERLATEVIKNCTLKYYKGNDITVDAIDNFVFNFFKAQGKLIGGLKILVIGLGNIGFKTSLKLLERGGEIRILSSDNEKAKEIVSVINIIKPKETISSAEIFRIEKIDAFDCILFTGLAPKKSNTEVLQNFIKNSSLILDVGKGCLNKEQLELLRIRNLIPYRLDVGDSLHAIIRQELTNQNEFQIPRLKSISQNLKLIEVGIVGEEGDVLMQNIDEINTIIGVCDGKGGLIQLNNNEKKNIIDRIKW